MSSQTEGFSVNLVAADRPVWSGQATSAVIPAESGAMGILVDHEPVLTIVKKGDVHLTPVKGEEKLFIVNDGFASFVANKLTIAVEACSVVEEEELRQKMEEGSSNES